MGDRQLLFQDALSHTQVHLIMIARALISNPEVLCIHKPTLAFDEKTSATVVHLLRQFVDDRGVEISSRVQHRKCHTCIMTSTRSLSTELADDVYLVKHGAPIQKITS